MHAGARRAPRAGAGRAVARSRLRRRRRRLPCGPRRCDRDRLGPLAGARRGRATPRAGARPRRATLEVADCQKLPYDDASFDVVSSSVGVDLCAGPRARGPASSPGSAGPAAASASPPGASRAASARCSPRWRRTCRRSLRASAPAFQWGEEDYVESMLGDAFELTFEELDTRHDGAPTTAPRRWAFYRANARARASPLWSSLDESTARDSTPTCERAHPTRSRSRERRHQTCERLHPSFVHAASRKALTRAPPKAHSSSR